MLRAQGVGARRSRADLHADDPRGRVRDAGLRAASAPSTRSCSAASPRRASPRASTTRSRRSLVTADAGMRGGKADAVQAAGRRGAAPRARIRRRSVIVVDRGLDRGDARASPGRDLDYATLRAQHADATVPCAWLESSEPSYILYTSGTTGQAEGRAARHRRLRGRAGRVDARHLLRWRRARRCSPPATSAGSSAIRTSSTGRCSTARRRSCTRACRSGPIPAIWWKHRRGARRAHDVQLADGDPRAEEAGSGVHAARTTSRRCATCSWPASRSTSRPRAGPPTRSACAIVDNYWQTETGWPILSAQPGVEDTPRKFGTPVVPRLRLRRAAAARGHGRGGRRRREGRARDRAAAAARAA